jgi:hypothetical protein
VPYFHSPRHLLRTPLQAWIQRHSRAALVGSLLASAATGAVLFTQAGPAALRQSANVTVATEVPPAMMAAVPAVPKETKPPAPASKMLDYWFQWQPNFYYCGPAATRIALSTRGVYPSQDSVAASLGTTVYGTNSANDVTRVLNVLGNTDFYKSHWIPGVMATQPEIERLTADVVNAVSNGFPVVANIVGSAVDVDGATHAYPGGHYLTVVGYSDGGQTVKIADPADAYGRGSYLMSTQRLAHWIGQRGYSA